MGLWLGIAALTLLLPPAVFGAVVMGGYLLERQMPEAFYARFTVFTLLMAGAAVGMAIQTITRG